MITKNKESTCVLVLAANKMVTNTTLIKELLDSLILNSDPVHAHNCLSAFRIKIRDKALVQFQPPLTKKNPPFVKTNLGS